MSHPPAKFELDRFSVRYLHIALQMFDDLFGGVIALAVGLVYMDILVVDFVADQQAQRQICHLTEHVQNGELIGRQWDPDRQALRLVVGVVDRALKHVCFKIAGIFAYKEWSKTLCEHRVEGFHLLGVADGDTFMAILDRTRQSHDFL